MVAALGLAALFVQGRQIRSEPSLGALSISGLWIQALIFALVGVSWMFRLTMPAEFWRMQPIRAVTTWFQLVGWAAVNNLVFAFVQAVLFFMARSKGLAASQGAESEPLLT